MARRIDEIQQIGLAISGRVLQRYALRFDGDAAFTLDIHGIEDLLRHLTLAQTPATLDDAVGKRGFPVIDMGDDRKIANVLH